MAFLVAVLISVTILQPSWQETPASTPRHYDFAKKNGSPKSLTVSEAQVTIEVDYFGPIGRIRSLQQVHSGPIPRQKGAAQLHEQYRQIGVDYIRPMSAGPCFDIDIIFPNTQADPLAESNYDFSATDMHVQAIRSIGAQVFYRLGYSWEPSSERAPRDYAKFAEVAKRVVMHYNHGWAKGFNYGIQYWEVWNEPDLKMFWAGTSDQYFRFYDLVARAVKSVDPSLKVGGPALSGGPVFANRGFLDDFLRFCKANGTPLDFVTWHIYPERSGPQLVPERAFQVQQMLRQHGFDKVENILGEWNIYPFGMESLPEARPLFWTARGAAWTASALIYLQNAPVSKAFWYRGDSDGGWPFGLFYDNGTFKKNGYAYLAMKKLLETPVRLPCTGSNNAGFATLAGRTREGDIVRVLISDFDAGYEEFALVFKDLPWRGRTMRYEVYLLDEAKDLVLVEKSEQQPAASITITRKITASSVYLIHLEAKEQATRQTTTTKPTFTSQTATSPPPLPTGSEPIMAAPVTEVFLIVLGLTAAAIVVFSYKLRRRAKTR